MQGYRRLTWWRWLGGLVLTILLGGSAYADNQKKTDMDFDQGIDVKTVIQQLPVSHLKKTIGVRAHPQQTGEKRFGAKAHGVFKNKWDSEPNTWDNFGAICNGEGTGSWSVCVTYEISPGEGGHEHNSNLPPLEFQEPLCQYGIPLNQPVYWNYLTPLFSGQIEFVGRFSGACSGSAELLVNVKTSGLSSLAAGTDYELVGQTATHPENHYGVSGTIGNLQTIATQYRQEFPNDSLLLYNDISLVWGGLFDIGNDWAPPHSSHRFGYQADVQRSTIPEAHRARFEEIATANGARILIEGTHYHLDFAAKGTRYYEEVLRCY